MVDFLAPGHVSTKQFSLGWQHRGWEAERQLIVVREMLGTKAEGRNSLL